jgi:hypothetical protein
MHQEVLMNVSETQVNTPETHRWSQCAGGDTDTGERDREINLKFSQQVSHRESTRTSVVQKTVTQLMKLRVDKETGTGRGHSGTTSEHIKEEIRDFGQTCGSVFHTTKHMQKDGQQIYVCATA